MLHHKAEPLPRIWHRHSIPARPLHPVRSIHPCFIFPPLLPPPLQHLSSLIAPIIYRISAAFQLATLRKWWSCPAEDTSPSAVSHYRRLCTARAAVRRPTTRNVDCSPLATSQQELSLKRRTTAGILSMPFCATAALAMRQPSPP